MTFSVVRDSREKQGWSFGGYNLVDRVISDKLDTGDYTVEGLRDILCIERKASVIELAKNSTEKRFWKTVTRMAQYPYAYFLLEFSELKMLQYPKGSGLPPSIMRKIKVRGKFLSNCVEQIKKEGIIVVFCDNKKNAEETAIDIMRSVYDVVKMA